MKVKRVIFLDVEPDDFILAVRAAKYLLGEIVTDAFLAYGDGPVTKDFYVRRNKASITVRPCCRPLTTGERE